MIVIALINGCALDVVVKKHCYGTFFLGCVLPVTVVF